MSRSNNKPKALTSREIEEIAVIEVVQEMWSAASVSEMADRLSNQVYAARFDFVSGSPGYVGPLYVLFGDQPTEPVRRIRTREVGLAILD